MKEITIQFDPEMSSLIASLPAVGKKIAERREAAAEHHELMSEAAELVHEGERCLRRWAERAEADARLDQFSMKPIIAAARADADRKWRSV